MKTQGKLICLLVGLVFCLVGCPENFTFDKTSGVPGDTVTITSNGLFTPCQGDHRILFGTVDTGCANAWTDNEVVLRVPPGYPAGTTVPVYLWYKDFFPFAIGEFTITGESSDYSEFNHWVWKLAVLTTLMEMHGVVDEDDDLYQGMLDMWGMYWDGTLGSLSPSVLQQISHAIVTEGDLPAIGEALIFFTHELGGCGFLDCEPSEAVVALVEKNRATAEAQFAVVLSDDPNPWASVARALGYISKTSMILGILSMNPGIMAATTLISIGADVAKTMLEHQIDNYAPTVTVSAFDPNLWEGSSIEFTITIDDIPPDDEAYGPISGVAEPTVYSVDPDPSVIVQIVPDDDLGGEVGPPRADFTFSISLADGTTLNDGMLYVVALIAYDKQGNTRGTTYLDFFIRKDVNEAPIIHFMDLQPGQIRLDLRDVDLYIPFTITEPDGNLLQFETRFSGTQLNENLYIYTSPAEAGINGSSDERQSGTVVIPDILRKLSWNTNEPIGCSVRFRAWDRQNLYATVYDTLYTLPTITGRWTLTVDWDGSPYPPFVTEYRILASGSGYFPSLPSCTSYWDLNGNIMWSMELWGYCGSDPPMPDVHAYYNGFVNTNSTTISGTTWNTIGETGVFTLSLIERWSPYMTAASESESESLAPLPETALSIDPMGIPGLDGGQGLTGPQN